VQALFPEAELHLLQVVKTETEVAAAQARILAFAQRHDLKHVLPAVATNDNVSSGIATHTRQVQADLLVVATHGRTGLSRLLHPSIAETVATHVFPPVLTFKLAQEAA